MPVSCPKAANVGFVQPKRPPDSPQMPDSCTCITRADKDLWQNQKQENGAGLALRQGHVPPLCALVTLNRILPRSLESRRLRGYSRPSR